MPVTSVPSAVIVTVASWPSATRGRSDSVTEAVTSSADERSVTAAPDGAVRPGITLTATTIPSTGVTSVARSITSWASATVCVACATATLSEAMVAASAGLVLVL